MKEHCWKTKKKGGETAFMGTYWEVWGPPRHSLEKLNVEEFINSNVIYLWID